jgi:hypothetical protein
MDRFALNHLTTTRVRICLICGLLVLQTWLVVAQGQPWVFPGAHWDQSKAPEDFGMVRAKLDAFKANMGGDSIGCVIKNGYLIYSWGNTAANFDWASASKPCLSTMLFAAINEGKVGSPDSLLLPYWPGLRPSDQTMTFRHLADMMRGYACNDRDDSGNLLPPGSRWAYNDFAIMLYVKTLDKVFGTADNLVTAGNQRFVVPLQFEDGVLFNSSKGRVQASARDFARMGWFWLNRGNSSGTQQHPGHFFDDYLAADVPLDTPGSTNSTADDYLGLGSYPWAAGLASSRTSSTLPGTSARRDQSVWGRLRTFTGCGYLNTQTKVKAADRQASIPRSRLTGLPSGKQTRDFGNSLFATVSTRGSGWFYP